MTSKQGATDSPHQIKLPSSIDQVLWTAPVAAVGASVGVEIFTHFVGNGAEIDIELSDHSGKNFGRYQEKISGNRFWAQIKVPADAEQALYATAKLPKHGLQMKSNPLILLPAVEITNLKWDKKEARRGDILKLTADVKGARDGAEGEIQIWEHDSDGAHDLITKFPVVVKDKKIEAEWEYEYHEDTDDIPTEEEAEKGYNPPEYFFRVKVEEVIADSEFLEFKDWVELELVDSDSRPIGNQQYVVYIADGSERKGQLDSEGHARIEDLPPGPITVEYPDALADQEKSESDEKDVPEDEGVVDEEDDVESYYLSTDRTTSESI